MLRQWNYDARGDSAAAAIFQAWSTSWCRPWRATSWAAQLTANYRELDRSSYVVAIPDAHAADARTTRGATTCGRRRRRRATTP